MSAVLRSTPFPCACIRRLLCFRPITFRPLRGDVLRVAAELEDVPKRDAQVLQYLPWRMRAAPRQLPLQRKRHVFHRRIEIEVRAAFGQQINQMFAKSLVVVHVPGVIQTLWMRWLLKSFDESVAAALSQSLSL